MPQRQLLELGVARKLLQRVDDVDVERHVRGDTVLAHPLVRERLRCSDPSLHIHWKKWKEDVKEGVERGSKKKEWKEGVEGRSGRRE